MSNWRERSGALVCAIVVTAIGLGPALAADKGCCDVNVLGGLKSLEEDVWAPVDTHTVVGVMTNWGKRGADWRFAADYIRSEDSAGDRMYVPGFGSVHVDVKGKTSELDLGVRYIPSTKVFRPFVGGGLAYLKATFEGEMLGRRLSESDSTLGVWVNGGVGWTITNHLNLGLEGRFSSGEVTLFGVEGDPGGFLVTGFIGVAF